MVRSSVRGYASGGWAPGDEAEAEAREALDAVGVDAALLVTDRAFRSS